jgi:parallel beta-helix repeat protein
MNKKTILIILLLLIQCCSINVEASCYSIKQNDYDTTILKQYETDDNELINTNINDFKYKQLIEPDFVPGELIVKFKEKIKFYSNNDNQKFLTTDITSVNLLNKKYSASFTEKITNSKSNLYKLNLALETDIQTAAEKYTNNPNVEYAEPNYIYQINIIPNDPLYNQQWALNNTGNNDGIPDSDIDAPQAWDITTGKTNITIAIADTGIDYTHPDLIENLWINTKEDINNNQKFDNWPKWRKKDGITGDIDNIDNDGNGYIDDVIGWNFDKNNNDPMDNFGHGTHCAGIAAAVTNNNKGISGISWNSKIMPIKIGSERKLDLFAAIEGINYCVENQADIISMSWGGPGYAESLKETLDNAYKKGIILVSGAGNIPIDIGVYSFFPASYKNIIAVSATNNKDELASFSSYGIPVTVAAPGVEILSLRAKNTNMGEDEKYVVDNDYYIASGTSMACPQVSGIVALILSKNPDLTPLEVETIIRSSTDKIITNKYAGIGRINAYTALQKTYPVTAKINGSNFIRDIKGPININGSAHGQGFQKYIIEYGKGVYPKNWTQYYNSTTPIKNNTLTKFNTSTLDDGVYTIRLKLITNQGTYEDRTLILINNIQNTYYVDDDGGKNYTDITTALYNSGKNDTIFVYNGTYNENLFIYRAIDLIGENNEKTIINATDVPITVISTNNIEISNFNLQGKTTGILALLTENLTIKNNIIQNFAFYAMIVVGTFGSIIQHNKINKNIIGLFTVMNTNNYIHNNTFNNNKIGINLNSDQINRITHNEINQNQIGILIYGFSFLNTIEYNNITNNKRVGLTLRRKSNGNQIKNNNFIKNTRAATFKGCVKNKWENNYWQRPRVLPKPIFGKMGLLRIPWINFDWNPTKTPNKI